MEQTRYYKLGKADAAYGNVVAVHAGRLHDFYDKGSIRFARNGDTYTLVEPVEYRKDHQQIARLLGHLSRDESEDEILAQVTIDDQDMMQLTYARDTLVLEEISQERAVALKNDLESFLSTRDWVLLG